jgi:hypothetical protein
MKKQPEKFIGIKEMLRRDEMRQIKAGSSGAGGGGGGFSCPSGTPVYQCTGSGFVWTTAWCCGGTPQYNPPAHCTLIGYTPALQAQDC